MLRGTFIIILFFKLSAIQAQEFFDLFQVASREQKVILSIVIKAGNTCQGLNFYRSTDSINYQLFGRIGGVCGNLSEPTPYTFIDENPPLNQLVYYKVEIPGYGYSNILQIVIRETAQGFIVAPNPSLFGQTKLLFTGLDLPDATGKLYNQTGQLIKQFPITSIEQTILLSDLTEGVYYLQIFGIDSQLIETKGIYKQ